MDFFDSTKEAPKPVDFPSYPNTRYDIDRPESPLIYSNYTWLYPDNIPSFEIFSCELPFVKIELNEKYSDKFESKSDSANDFAQHLRLSISKDELLSNHSDDLVDPLDELLPQNTKLKPRSLSIDIPPSPMDMLPSPRVSIYNAQRDRTSSITSVATNISAILNNYSNTAEKQETSITEWKQISVFSNEYKEFLLMICSSVSYPVSDKFWPNLLSIDYPLINTKDAAFEVYSGQEYLKYKVLDNCPFNGNIYSLLNHLIVRLLNSSNNKSSTRDVLNALALFRFFCFIIECEFDLSFFNPSKSDNSPVKTKPELDILCELLIKTIQNSNFTSLLHISLYNESIHVLVLLMNNVDYLNNYITLEFANKLLANALSFTSPSTLYGLLSIFATTLPPSLEYYHSSSLYFYLLVISKDIALLDDLDYNLVYKSLEYIEQLPLLQTLLFLVIHNKPSFIGYLKSKSDPESFIIPILHVIHNNLRNKNRPACSLYISLLLLFILTNDSQYAQQLQNITIANAPVFIDKRMGNTSLLNIVFASCTLLLIYNSGGHKDKYIQSMSLYILYQIANNIKQIHPYGAHKFIAMMESFYKKFNEGSTVYYDILINCINVLNVLVSSNNVKQNVNIIYCLIYKQNLFEAIGHHEGYEEYSMNILKVLQINVGGTSVR
eukprot:NODE_81_length_22753_cov_0.207072.p4 type:complete len:664 gc:universal NODE_81_length_22753_cov_0.207072:2183-4174(+)